MRVAVLYGGPGGEHEVSVASGAAVLAALRGAGHEVQAVLLERSGRWRSWGPSAEGWAGLPTGPASAQAEDAMAGLSLLRGADVCVPALHGAYGEGGVLQGALDAVGIPYIGSRPLAAALAMHKVWSRRLFAAAGLKIPAGAEVSVDPGAGMSPGVTDVVRAVPGPWVVKPVNGGSSLGMSLVDRPEDLPAACALATEGGAPSALVETRLTGSEVTCAVLEAADGTPEALPVILIRPRLARTFDYASKYSEGGAEELCPAPIPDAEARAVRHAAVTAHLTLGCRGFSRTDMFLDERGGPPVVLELNTIPGMTPQSLVPKALRAAGLSFLDMVERLIARSTV